MHFFLHTVCNRFESKCVNLHIYLLLNVFIFFQHPLNLLLSFIALIQMYVLSTLRAKAESNVLYVHTSVQKILNEFNPTEKRFA